MDRQSFIELLEGHADRVYSYACYVLQDPEDAADVVQEAFLRLWQRGGALEERGRVAWLQRVAHNLCVDRRRRRRTWRQRTSCPSDTAPAPTRSGTCCWTNGSGP
jgi:RNA polymerase sigma-70 factor (ECF subfamily)